MQNHHKYTLSDYIDTMEEMQNPHKELSLSVITKRREMTTEKNHMICYWVSIYDSRCIRRLNQSVYSFLMFRKYLLHTNLFKYPKALQQICIFRAYVERSNQLTAREFVCAWCWTALLFVFSFARRSRMRRTICGSTEGNSSRNSPRRLCKKYEN